MSAHHPVRDLGTALSTVPHEPGTLARLTWLAREAEECQLGHRRRAVTCREIRLRKTAATA